jgi:hypothetical protein
VALVRTDVSEEHIVFSIRVTRIGELGTTLAVISKPTDSAKNASTPILVNLMMETLRYPEILVLTKATVVKFQKTTFFIVTAVKTSSNNWLVL